MTTHSKAQLAKRQSNGPINKLRISTNMVASRNKMLKSEASHNHNVDTKRLEYD